MEMSGTDGHPATANAFTNWVMSSPDSFRSAALNFVERVESAVEFEDVDARFAEDAERARRDVGDDEGMDRVDREPPRLGDARCLVERARGRDDRRYRMLLSATVPTHAEQNYVRQNSRSRVFAMTALMPHGALHASAKQGRCG